MAQIANLRQLFFFPCSKYYYSSSSLFLFKTKTLSKPLFPFTTIFSSSSSSSSSRSSRRNNFTTLREDKKEKPLFSMEENNNNNNNNNNSGFNKRRAEGRDKNDKPKNLQLKVRKLNPNTSCYVQVLGTGLDTQDTSPSVLLFFDKQRFIFNAGEGLQRFCTEHKIKLSKIDHIFFSRVCSETAGGLPGLLLTLAGMGDEGMSVNICGPSDLKYLVDAMRSFIPNAAMVHTRSFGPPSNANGASLYDQGKFTEPIVLIDDEVVKISAILLRASCSGGSQLTKKNPSSVSLQEKKDRFAEPLASHLQNPDRKGEVVLKPGDMSVVYVCELPEIKGKFDPAKAKALGLKPGPNYRELQYGTSVMSDTKNIMIHPSDVLGPSIPGPIVLIVDCPTLSHLQELLSVQSLNSYYADSTDGVKSVNCVIHLSPSSITMTPEYQMWMDKFGSAQHIMAGHEIKNMEIPILKASARVAARLNYLCPNFFPAPGFWVHQQLNNIGEESMASSEGSIPKTSQSSAAENLLKFYLRPYAQLGLDRSAIPDSLASGDIISELHTEIPEIVDAAEQVSRLWNNSGDSREVIVPPDENVVMIEEPWMNGNSSVPDIKESALLPSCLENITREDMEVVLLGTGSSQPSKYRNVTSIFINLFAKGSLLLDCGEGTLGQLKRRFGVMGADDAVRGLRCIWISHIHADHHTGLARILALRSQLLRDVPHEPLLVIGPKQLKRFLDAYQRLEDLDMQFLDCRHTTVASLEVFKSSLESSESCSSPGSPNSEEDVNKRDNRVGEITRNIETNLFAKGSRMESYWKRPGSPVDTSVIFQILKDLKRVLGEAGLEALISVPVVHCPQAFGIVLKASERVNSVGKTIPGWKLVYSGDTRPCPELIDASRGATVLIHEATFEDSLVEEAIARNHSTTKEAIEVGNSAGAYRIILTHFSQRYPKIPVLDETYMNQTCIGFDLMSVNVADLPVLPKVLPYLKLLFKDEIDEPEAIVRESDEVLEALI